MTPEQQELAWTLINNPPSGSKLAEAKEFGIDLTLLLSSLNLTVTQRLRNLYAIATFLEKMSDARKTLQR